MMEMIEQSNENDKVEVVVIIQDDKTKGQHIPKIYKLSMTLTLWGAIIQVRIVLTQPTMNLKLNFSFVKVEMRKFY